MTVQGALKRLAGTGGYEICCDACGQPGATGTDRDELQSLADLHNCLIHRGQQVATVENA